MDGSFNELIHFPVLPLPEAAIWGGGEKGVARFRDGGGKSSTTRHKGVLWPKYLARDARYHRCSALVVGCPTVAPRLWFVGAIITNFLGYLFSFSSAIINIRQS